MEGLGTQHKQLFSLTIPTAILDIEHCYYLLGDL